MANNIRICKACGTEYEYCPTCAKYANLPKWMWKCDTEECNDIFDAISAYKMGVGSVDMIQNAINKHNVKNYSKFVDSIQKCLTELLPIKPNKMIKKHNRNYEEMDIELNLDTKDDEKVVTDESEFNGISEVE